MSLSAPSNALSSGSVELSRQAALPARNPRSCDACRVRKTRCRRDRDFNIVDNIATNPCINCTRWGQCCSFLRERKRQGKQGDELRNLVDRQRIHLNRLGLQATSRRGRANDVSTQSQETVTSNSQSIIPFPYDPHPEPSIEGPMSTARQRYSTIQLTSDDRDESEVNVPARPTSSSIIRSPSNPGGALSPAMTFADTDNNNDFDILAFLKNDAQLLSDTLNDVPRDLHAGVPVCLETYIDRSLALRMLALFFNHVYGIIPIVHRPSFLLQFADEQDKASPKFLALVLAMIATTLVHVPQAFVPDLNIHLVSKRCITACQEILRSHRSVPDVDTVCIKYFELVVHVKHGETGSKMSTYGELIGFMNQLGYYQESTYFGKDPIEAERMRRVWFLVHNADKFEAVESDRPVIFRSDEYRSAFSANLPIEVDDDFITSQGIAPPGTEVPVVAGLNVLTKTVTVLGDVLVCERNSIRNPPTTPEQILDRLEEARPFGIAITRITGGLQAPFAVDADDAYFSTSPGWQAAIQNEIDVFVRDPTTLVVSGHRDAFLVLKANIHVTLAVTRLRLIAYKEALLDHFGPPDHPSRAFAEVMCTELGRLPDSRMKVYQNLLQTLRSIPLQALIVNGPSLVAKLRMVASTLLSTNPVEVTNTSTEESEFTFLLDLLNILTNIELQAPIQLQH